MFAVIFEVKPKPERWDDYLHYATMLRPELERIDGFIDNERFGSQRREGWLLSLSTWRDEKSLIRWRTQALHHEVQEKGRFEIFQDYRLRVGEVIADNQLPPERILRDQRLDETECDAAKLITLTERVSHSLAPDVAALGSPAGLVEWEVFESIYQRGKLVLLASWREASAVPAREAPDSDARHRRIRVIRSYGMFERAEAPQYYPPLPQRPV
ncbi:MAG TPA: antibiotic biosynthesis monooxygenase [Stellaceae bacterium]|nr:antibiotic biosynthesis monooxygenase [Stellaceae bacterium]